MFGIGGFELFIILVFGFLIFGPDKLPDIARTVGKGIARFREAQQEMNDVLGDEKLIDLNDPDQPIKDPMEALDRIAQRQEEKRAASSKGAGSVASSGKSSAESSDEDAASAESDTEPKQESFTERKARYERERAARKAAEAEAAAAAKAEAEAKVDVAADIASAEAEAPAATESSETAQAAEAAPEPSVEGGDA